MEMMVLVGIKIRRMVIMLPIYEEGVGLAGVRWMEFKMRRCEGWPMGIRDCVDCVLLMSSECSCVDRRKWDRNVHRTRYAASKRDVDQFAGV